jgi:hypothetical protein
LLLVKKRWFNKQLLTSYHLNVIASNSWGYILCKKKIS